MLTLLWVERHLPIFLKTHQSFCWQPGSTKSAALLDTNLLLIACHLLLVGFYIFYLWWQKAAFPSTWGLKDTQSDHDLVICHTSSFHMKMNQRTDKPRSKVPWPKYADRLLISWAQKPTEDLFAVTCRSELPTEAENTFLRNLQSAQQCWSTTVKKKSIQELANGECINPKES